MLGSRKISHLRNAGRALMTLALVASVAKSAATPAPTAANSATPARPGIAQSVPRAQAPHEKACEPGMRRRDSELCAAWVSADAAEASARWSFIQAVLAGLSALGLFVSLFFTWRALRLAIVARGDADEALDVARQNAIAASELAKHSKDATEVDLRAWVSIELEIIHCSRTNDFAHVSVRVRLHNRGRTPALRVGISAKASCVPSLSTGSEPPPEAEKYPSQMSSLMPGAEVEQIFGLRISKADLVEGADASRKAGFAPMIQIDAIVSYATVFDKNDTPQRMTSTRHGIFPAISMDARQARMSWLDERGPAALDEVKVGQLKGAAVHMS